MGLTVNNTNALTLLNVLTRTSNAQSESLTRLSTGYKINTGKDDPAGLIALKSLDFELTSVDSALNNNQRTDAMVGVVDNALGEVSKLLSEIGDLASKSTNDSGLSAAEISANQSQIDAAIASIDRIVGTTTFNGKKLLDGTLGVQTNTIDQTRIGDLQVYSRDSSGSQTFTVQVNTAATQANHTLATTSAASDTTINLQGENGTVVIEIAAGENLSSIANKVNAATAQTGVTATVSGANLDLDSSEYGSDGFVRVTVLSGDSTNIHAQAGTNGTDADVLVNGQTAAVDGLKVNYTANGASFSFNITEGFNDGTISGSATVSLTGGGGTFQLGTDSSTRTTIGVNALYSHLLGDTNLGHLSDLRGGGSSDLFSDPNKAAQIARAAASQVATLQGRIGGFQKFQVGSAISQLQAAKEGLSSAVSSIRDVDYAAETSELQRQNVLLQSAISMMGIVNQRSSQVLSLLR